MSVFDFKKYYSFFTVLSLGFFLCSIGYSQTSEVYDYFKTIDSLKLDNQKLQFSQNESLLIINNLEISKNYYFLGDYDNAIDYALSANKTAKRLGHASEANTYIYLGNFYAEKKEYSEALIAYKNAMHFFEKQNDINRKSVALTNIAVLFEWTDNDSLSLKYHLEALALKKQIGDSLLLAESYINIGNTLADLNQKDRSHNYYKLALAIYKKEKDEKGISSIYNNLGFLYQSRGDLHAALDAFQASLYIDKRLNDLGALEVSSFNVGHLFYDLHKNDSAMHYLKYSQTISKQIYGLHYLLKSSELIANIALDNKDYEFAKKVFSDYANYSDSLYNEEKLQAFLAAKNDLRLQQKEFENRILKENRNYSNRVIFWVSTAGTLLLIILIISLVFIRKSINSRRELSILNNDLSEKNEEIEQQKEHLEAISLEKDNLMSVLAHDLRSPLSGIKGLNEVLKDEGNFTEFQKELAQTIDVAVDSGLKLINDILLIKRMEELKDEVIYQHIEPVSFTQSIQEIFQSLLIKKEQKLELNLISEESLYSNRNYLSSILENLISNAIKYSETNKTTILSYYTTDTDYCFEVRDEGLGIPEEEKHLLFKKFQKLSARPTANEFSTGLGLYIVKSFTSKLSGSIEVQSELGKGSTFIVKLPKLKPE